MSTAPANNWRPGDLEAIRIALGINATRPAVDAIHQAMLQLSPADHQGWSEQQRKGPLPGSSAAAGIAPASQVDVVHYATELLQVEERLVSKQPISTADALQRQRLTLCGQLLLILPARKSWRSQGQSELPPFTTALLRG